MESSWEEVAADCRELFVAGRRVEAWQKLQPHHVAGFADGAPEFLRLAHDLSWWLGFTVRRAWIGRRIWRLHRSSLWAVTRHVFDAIRAGRLLECHERLLRNDLPQPEDDDDARWLELARARVLSSLRDFRGSQQCLDGARARFGDCADLQRERAWTQFRQDDADGALDTCRRARSTWSEDPFLREQESWLLLQMHRTDEALSSLEATCAHVSCPSLELMYAEALFEARELTRCQDRLERVVAGMPLDKHQHIATHMLLARTLRELGDDHAALASMRTAGPRVRKWTERLRAFLDEHPDGGGRKVLNVPFKRQDHVTCAPATMASLLAHSGLDIDQREIAKSITYDGTASHAEMRWAEERGLGIWFFQFGLDIAHELIDLELPFALSTRSEQMGHRQAICGYDLALGTLIVRDPSYSSLQELDAATLQEHMASRGGDCALLLPAADAGRVPVARLPFHDEMTRLQELRRAFDDRNLDRADRLADQLLASAPGTVRWEAATRVAYEREDRRERLRLYRERYEQHRDDPYWQYHYAAELHAQDRWQPMLELLEQHAGGKKPNLALMLAEHLRHAAPTRARAEQLARRAARLMPLSAHPVRVLADIYWSDSSRREHALELYRVAATLESRNEQLAQSYFDAARMLGRRDEALQLLRQRVVDFGDKRWEARTTLANALASMHRREEAVAVMREALRDHDDPFVRERLFDLLLTDRQRNEAAALLDAPERWREFPLLDARRRLALAEGDREAASAALARAVAIDPTNGAAWVARLRDMVATDGLDAALTQAAHCVDEHGDNPQLLIRIQEFYDEVEQPAASEALLRRLADEHPREFWLLGRLTRHLIRTERAAEAMPHVETMLRQMPDNLAVWLDAIDACEALDDLERGRELARKAAERWADEPALLARRRQLAASRAQSADAVREASAAMLGRHTPPRRNELDYMVAVIDKDLDDDAVERFLQPLQERFPDDPEIAAARCAWQMNHDRQQAVEIATRLRDEFPWMLDNWLLLCRAMRAAGLRQKERALLEELIAREPTFAQAFVELGESLEQEGRTQDAMATYTRGLAQAPNDAVLHGMRANLRWELGERDGALRDADRAALLDPAYGWVRRVQVVWRGRTGAHDEALAAAQACVRDNPSWPLSYELLASAHAALGNQQERVDALRKALRLAPRIGDARHQLLNALLELHMFEEAASVVDEGLELLGDDPSLHLVQLRIQRQRGELPQARDGLRALLERHTDFTQGWLRLLQWLDEEHLDTEVLKICEQPPAAIADHSARFCYSADVRIRKNNLRGAENDLRAALERAPDHDWARDRLAFVLLSLGKPEKVPELFPGATDPEHLPFDRASLLCEALIGSGRSDDAEAFFMRLMREPDANIDALRSASSALRSRWPNKHRALMRDMLSASEQERDVQRHENLLSIAVADGRPKFWSQLDRFAAWIPAGDRDATLARLVYLSNSRFPAKDIERWVRRHFTPPIQDTETWARLVYALNKKESARTAAALTDGDYRRRGVRGWMLANLSGVYSDLDAWDTVEEVSTYALSADVPSDHSVWWHRRFLAECAYRRSEFDRALELCEMATEDYPREKVRVAQIATLARIATASGFFAKRRALREGLPEILRQAELAEAELLGAYDTVHLEWWRLFRAAPTLRGLCLALGWRRLVAHVWGD